MHDGVRSPSVSLSHVLYLSSGLLSGVFARLLSGLELGSEIISYEDMYYEKKRARIPIVGRY